MKEMMNGLIRKFDIEIYEFDKQIQHEWRGLMVGICMVFLNSIACVCYTNELNIVLSI